MHGQISKLDQGVRSWLAVAAELQNVAQPRYEVRRLSDGSIDRKYYVALSHSIRRTVWRAAFRQAWRRIAGAARAAVEWIDAGCRPL
jgi:hypothetical protein